METSDQIQGTSIEKTRRRKKCVLYMSLNRSKFANLRAAKYLFDCILCFCFTYPGRHFRIRVVNRLTPIGIASKPASHPELQVNNNDASIVVMLGKIQGDNTH